jgi:hypothetical protein
MKLRSSLRIGEKSHENLPEGYQAADSSAETKSGTQRWLANCLDAIDIKSV